ncbi:hypothetical protein DB346_23860 [Verrucomicrobia bacterium LW23]|nr:hypothetical protein DB346_23860 [Verrucomicrobia bacterium LW23]
MHDRPRKRDDLSREKRLGDSTTGENPYTWVKARHVDSYKASEDVPLKPVRRAGWLDRIFPSMMRSASFWVVVGLVLGIYMIAFLFFKDMVIIPAPAVPGEGVSPVAYLRRVLDGFYGKYEERVVEQRADGTTIVEKRFTVPTRMHEVAPMGQRPTNLPAATRQAELPPVPES